MLGIASSAIGMPSENERKLAQARQLDHRQNYFIPTSECGQQSNIPATCIIKSQQIAELFVSSP